VAIHLRCPKCGSSIHVEEQYAGRLANCPVCWDPVHVPSSPIRESVVCGDSKHRHTTDELSEPIPRLIAHALVSAMRQHSRYFVAGLLLFLGVSFVCCGGLGAVRNYFGPEKSEAPTKAHFDEPVKLPDMMKKLDQE